MGYSVFLEAMLEIALSLFPLFEGSFKGDLDMKRSQNDAAEIYSVLLHSGGADRYLRLR